MTCIYNDDYFEVVDSDEEYDKSVFAVVYTIFIRLNEKYENYSEVSSVLLNVYQKPYNDPSIILNF